MRQFDCQGGDTLIQTQPEAINMLFSCKPQNRATAKSLAATKAASRKTIKVKGKSRAISVDLHCHVHTDAADAIAKQSASRVSPTARYGNPRTEAQQKKLHDELHKKLTDVDQRIAD